MFNARLILAAALLLTTASTAVAAPGPSRAKAKIDGSCAGDSITGKVSLQAPAGTTYRLRLYYRKQQRINWLSTGRSSTLTGMGKKHVYSYRFDVSAFDAFSYKVDLGAHKWTRTIPAASCAPGRQVPEAPFALILPLSLLATSVFFLRRRRPRLQ